MESTAGRASLRRTRRASPKAAARPICWALSNSLMTTSRSLSPISRTISAGIPHTRSLTGSVISYGTYHSGPNVAEGIQLRAKPSQSELTARVARCRTHEPYRNDLVAGTFLGEAEHGVPLRAADFLN